MSAAPRELALRVTEFRPNESRTRIGHCSLLFPQLGLTIRAIEVHRFKSYGGDVRVWLAYPGRPYKRDGVQRTWPVIFFNRSSHGTICDQAIEQLTSMAPDLFADAPAAKAEERAA